MSELVTQSPVKIKFQRTNMKEKGILFALILLWLILFATNENFRYLDSYLGILREASFIGIAAIGMTFCIISGNFDLSVGAMLALLSLLTVSLIGQVGIVIGLIIILLAGAILGSFNGLLVTMLKIPAFIATLATYFIFRAVAFIYSDGTTIQFSEKGFTVLGNGNVLGLPIPFVLFVLLTLLGTIILRRTSFGRHTLAVGNSEKASKISGISIIRSKILIFATVGVFTAVSAILLSSRLWSASPGMKEGFEFDVIAAVVLGGTPLTGGKGSVFNTFIAAIFLATLNTAMNLFQVDSYVQKVVIGVMLLLALSVHGIQKLFGTFFKKAVE